MRDVGKTITGALTSGLTSGLTYALPSDAAGALAPNQMGTLPLAWFQPSGQVITSGKVTTWTNNGTKASYNATVPAGAATGPAQNVGGLNGQNFADFNGTDMGLGMTGVVMNTASVRTVFVACKVDSTIGFASNIFGAANGSNIGVTGNGLFTRNDDSNVAGTLINGNIGANAENSNTGVDIRCPNAIVDQWLIADYVMKAGVSDLYINGKLWARDTLENTPSISAGTIDEIGYCSNGLDKFFKGGIAEIVVYDFALTAAQRAGLRSHLSTKFTIAQEAANTTPLVSGSGTANILLIWGQSNAAGVAELSSSLLFTQDQTVTGAHIWTRRGWEDLKAGVNNEERVSSGSKLTDYGCEMQLAKLITDAGQTVFIVKCPVNGTNLEDDWYNNGTTTRNASYSSALAQAIDARDALTALGYTPVFKKMLWVQGESDSQDAKTTQAGHYEANLNGLIADMRTQLSTAGLSVIIARTHVTASGYSNQATVRTAQAAVDTADALVDMVDVDSHTLAADGLHRTAVGYEADAASYAAVYLAGGGASTAGTPLGLLLSLTHSS